MMNGWISIYEDEKPGSGEQVLTLSYMGAYPPSQDPFGDPGNRFYAVLSYFYPGDTDIEEVLGDKERGIPGDIKDVTFDEEGFYTYEADIAAGGACIWRRIADATMVSQGVVFWKHLDWPT